MVVLMVGGGSPLMDALISKLNKNGHRVYLLAGAGVKKYSYAKVFEKYNFPYESESVGEILEGVRPDTIIFTGAYDTNFDWDKPKEESVRYVAGLINILTTFSLQKSGRFIYLSSQDVYGRTYPDSIKENEPVSPQGIKALTISQGEEICEDYHKSRNMDLTVLRLDHLYAVPKKEIRNDDECYKKCLSALRDGKIPANDRVSYSMLYLDDATEAIYKVVAADQVRHNLYHISPMETITDMDLAKIVQKEMGSDAVILDNSVGDMHRLVLNSEAFKKEFNFEFICKAEDVVPRVASHMKRHRSDFLSLEDKGLGLTGKLRQNTLRILKALVPFVETLVLFIPFFMLNNRTTGSLYFSNLDFYLLYVLLLAIVHGQQQATFAALLATAGYCFRQMYTRSGFEVFLDYNTYVWIAQLFILGLVVGYMRDRLREIKKEDDEEIEYLHSRVGDIADINSSNVRMKQMFETEIINQHDSLGKIYSITSRLDQYEVEQVLFYAAEILSELVDSKDVAIYQVANGDYARLVSSTSDDARQLGGSIKYSAMEELYEDIKNQRVYVNKTMDDAYPLMANGIYAEDNLELILMVWNIPWENMNLAQANRLTVVGYLIQNASLRAARYLESLKSERYIAGTQILDPKAFTSLVRAYQMAGERGLAESILLEVVSGPAKDIATLGDDISRKLRRNDYLGFLSDDNIYILLANTNSNNTDPIIERFKEVGYTCRLVPNEEVVL